MTSKVIHGHIRPLLCQNHSSTFISEPILIKIYMDANIMKTPFFINLYIYGLKCHFMTWSIFAFFFTLRPSDLIATVNYVLMNNFCFIFIWFISFLFQIIPLKYNSFEKLKKCADITAFTRNIKKVHFI